MVTVNGLSPLVPNPESESVVPGLGIIDSGISHNVSNKSVVFLDSTVGSIRICVRLDDS